MWVVAWHALPQHAEGWRKMLKQIGFIVGPAVTSALSILLNNYHPTPFVVPSDFTH
jgi:hypothetical protein